ncbi:MAG TPA: anhydro-N-acetylmuramic acid kinase [Planctomycetota bacterium]|nr:anhydro-N-acetylmuramic acid kinase [Planctomycetota bacterium]
MPRPTPLDRIASLARRGERLVAGVLSGTSADGVSVALVRIRGAGPGAEVRVVRTGARRYPRGLAAALLRAPFLEAPEIARLSLAVADAFAAAVRGSTRGGSRLDLVGSHGQTIFHGGASGTLQIGEGDRIAERLRVPVVSDFRQRDVAAGGEGAPLTPYADFVLFGGRAGRAVLNLGGIANLTILGRSLEEVRGFDTGPANMVSDGLVAAAGGKKRFDAGGRLALRGRVLGDLLRWMLAHPFVRRRPPKSTGREEFGEPFLRALLQRAPRARPEDLLATAAEFTAATVALSIKRFLPARLRPSEILVAGGGVRNAALLRALRRRLAPASVRSTAVAGIDPLAREAVAFAILANDAVAGLPTSLPAVTGARRAVTLGKLSFP